MQNAKLTEPQKEEIAQRFAAGESQASLAKVYEVAETTIRKYCKRFNAKRVPEQQKRDLNEFTSRVRSILWRQDTGSEKKTYESWVTRVSELESNDGGNYTKNQSIVRASKEYPCLHRLFREYDVSEYDPNPDSHPTIQYFGKTPGADFASVDIVCEGKEQSYRESLRWAINAAGSYLRTGKAPEICPCDAAWYLYRQAIEEPKDFLAKVGQMESKGDMESEERKNARKAGQRSISEIDSMLAEISLEEEEENDG